MSKAVGDDDWGTVIVIATVALVATIIGVIFVFTVIACPEMPVQGGDFAGPGGMRESGGGPGGDE